MTLTQTISLLAGALLSLLFSYVPKLAPWFDKQESTVKRLIMLGCLAAIALVLFGAACANLLGQLPLGLALTCDQNGAVTLAVAFVLALVGNQSAYLITPAKQSKTDQVLALMASMTPDELAGVLAAIHPAAAPAPGEVKA